MSGYLMPIFGQNGKSLYQMFGGGGDAMSDFDPFGGFGGIGGFNPFDPSGGGDIWGGGGGGFGIGLPGGLGNINIPLPGGGVNWPSVPGNAASASGQTAQSIQQYLPLLLPIISALAGSQPTPFSSNTNTSQKTTGQTDTQNNLNSQIQGTQSNTSTTAPVLSPATQALFDQLTSRFSSLSAPNLSNGFQANRIAQINKNSDLQSQAVNNIMAARGLSTSPASGTAQSNIEAQRFGQIADFQNQLPLLQNQLNLQNLNAAGAFAGSIPRGTTTTGSGTSGQTGSSMSTGTTVNNNTVTGTSDTSGKSGGGLGGLLAGLGSTLTNPNVSGALGQLLGGIFSDERLKKDIKRIDKATDKILALKPKTWKWKGGEVSDDGFIAQEVQKVLPELVHEDKELNLLKINYAGLIPFLVQSVQEMHEQVEALK